MLSINFDANVLSTNSEILVVYSQAVNLPQFQVLEMETIDPTTWDICEDKMRNKMKRALYSV